MRTAVALLAALLVSACTGQAVVPSVTVDTPIGLKPTPGNYAATVQSGGWDLQTKSQGMSCGAWTFDTNINPSYESAMQDVLKRSLEKVTFTSDILSPEQLKSQGYIAQVVIHQGNADSSFSISPNFFSGTVRGDITLSVILAIRDESGVAYQNTVTGRGLGSKDVFGCPAIGEAVGAAAQDAIQAIVKDIILNVRDGLNNRQLAGKPTS
jgi:hypothetical protein